MHSLKDLSYARTAAIAAIILCVTPALAVDNLPEVYRQGNISYISGGIGGEERRALEAVQNHYNLRIMSADRTGHFFGDTHIVISDREHHPLLNMTGGPLFFANLPNGRYMVEGFNEGESKKQVITIAGGKPVRIHFSWQQNLTDVSTR